MKVKNTLVICQSTNASLGQSICHLGHLERHDSVSTTFVGVPSADKRPEMPQSLELLHHSEKFRKSHILRLVPMSRGF